VLVRLEGLPRHLEPSCSLPNATLNWSSCALTVKMCAYLYFMVPRIVQHIMRSSVISAQIEVGGGDKRNGL
jgi:hypothetical protein